MFKYFLDTFRVNYFRFSGRVGRKEFWSFQLFNLFAFFFIAIGGNFLAWGNIDNIFFSYIPSVVYFLFAIIPSLAISVRRLHDTNRSGALILIGLIPLIGAITLVLLYCMTGDKGPNEYGFDPKNPHMIDELEIGSIGENLIQ
ncbi:Uncharacterized membrane protein YhaH, DUF805 family [Spirosomataceae bacterium TFI 002]|nr:Uncharacterized membrane protein YhaH, DUF805 family [Spirosomataceae bacterium TFI 002]